MDDNANFRSWYNNADMPTQADDGSWYDLETGIPFLRRTAVKAAKNPLAKRSASELTEKLSRQVASARISLERSAVELPLLAAFVRDFDAAKKVTKARAIELLDQCSAADKEANAFRNA